MPPNRGYVSCCRPADAADPDDDLIGLLPAALSTGIGSQVQRPLATVIVDGMLIGPVMLLVIVPALQSYLLGRENVPEPRTSGRD
jgi:hypothetical protein